jgi:hypothetical protein
MIPGRRRKDGGIQGPDQGREVVRSPYVAHSVAGTLSSGGIFSTRDAITHKGQLVEALGSGQGIL